MVNIIREIKSVAPQVVVVLGKRNSRRSQAELSVLGVAQPCAHVGLCRASVSATRNSKGRKQLHLPGQRFNDLSCAVRPRAGTWATPKDLNHGITENPN